MPTSYITSGLSVIWDQNDMPTSFQTATFEIIGLSGAVPTLTYTYTGTDPNDTTVEIDDTGILGGTINGQTISDNSDFRIEQITTQYGTSQIMLIEDFDTGREYVFLLGGAVFPMPTNLTEFMAIGNSITSQGRVTSGTFAPGNTFSLTDFYGIQTAAGGTVNGTGGDDELNGGSTHDLIQGFSGNDTLNGGEGSDEIIPGTNTEFDIVQTGAGSDYVDYTNSTYGFQVLSYAGDTTAINVYINGTDNEADVQQGNDWDQLNNVATAMTWSESNPIGGLMVIGTSGADSFNINTDATLNTGQWVAVQGGAGADSYNFWGFGQVRLDLRGGSNGVSVDLSANTVYDDGFGNVEHINGNVWEVRGTDHTDTIYGSGLNEGFILRGGNDTLDAGGGYDRLRYDRSGVTGVTANMVTGIVTGVWDGSTFTHTVSNVEYVRGSSSADVLTASADTQAFRGGDGADRFVIANGGTLSIDDFELGTDTLDLTNLGLTEEQIDAALANATTISGGIQLSLNGSFVMLQGLTTGQAPSITYVGAATSTGTSETFVFDDSSLTFVEGSDGNDTYDFSALAESYASIGYYNLSTGITVNINGEDNTGTVYKGANGTDTLVDVATALYLGWSTGGLGITGTSQADTFNLHTAGYQWMQVSGMAGNDTFTISGDGRVRLDYASSPGGINADLSTGQIQDGHGNTDTFTGDLWEIRSNHNNDTILGSDRAESFILRGGNDDLDGGGGADRVRYDRSGVGDVSIDLGTGIGTGVWSGNAFTHTLINIENIRGSNTGNDTLTGDGNVNEIYGRGGNDTIFGQGGDDRLVGEEGDDSIIGGDGRDSLFGGDGNDTLDASHGDLGTEGVGDYVRPGLGTNTIIGNADTWAGDVGIALSYSDLSGVGGVTVTTDQTGSGTTASGSAGMVDDTFSYVYYFQGSSDDDVFTSTHTSGQRGYAGLWGNDTFNGGSGNDMLDYWWDDTYGSTSGINASMTSAGAGTVQDGFGYTDSFTGIEQIRGTNFADFILGHDGNELFRGSDGNDTLNGAGGNDTLEGGDGSDTLIGGEGDDIITGGETEDDLRDVVYAGAGNDSVDGGYGNDELRGDAGNDTLLGSYGADTVIGGDGDDNLTSQAYGDEIFGGNGNDFINGGFGHDRVNGGADADRFFHLGVFDHGSDWIQDYNAAEGDVLQFGQAGTRDQFQLNYAETASAGVEGVEEIFVIYRPTGQILWALVDGAAQSEINLLMGGVTYDLMA